jgi:uncharacterized protein
MPGRALPLPRELVARDTAVPSVMVENAPWATRLEEGRLAFNRGAFFEAHELWEDAWRELTGAQRVLVQGLIQISAGLHHLQHGRRRPAAGLLGKGLAKLSRGAPAPAGLRTASLAVEVARLLKELETSPGPPDLRSLEL